jgi:hypothetical protein
MEKAGYPVSRVELAHISNDFLYLGDGNYAHLFRLRDITDRVKKKMSMVRDMAESIPRILEGPLPERETGNHCCSPHECPFIDYCTKAKPQYPISILIHGGTLVEELERMGYRDLRDVPQSLVTKDHHKMIHEATITGIPHVNPYLSFRFSRLAYPRFFLDFEAIQFAVPIWEKTKPFEQLLFQWSCHKKDSADSLFHTEFLDCSGSPPMQKAAEELIRTLGDTGPVFVYSSFEKSIIASIMKRFPVLSEKLKRILPRLIDLLPLLRKFFYHPEMKGSWSIKSVLPAIAPELSYANLAEVKNGASAQSAYLEAIDPRTIPSRREELLARLSEYCKRDTLALVRIVDYFEKQPRKK